VTTYKIIRFHVDPDHPDHGKVIRTGLTLTEARSHTQDPGTHVEGEWFDGYTEEIEGASSMTVRFNDGGME
jgi:hypothetical protein